MRKAYRVKKERELQVVLHTGDSFANCKFVVYRLEKLGQPHLRVGLPIGRKVGNAVNCNEVKRKIRAAVYSIKEEIDLEPDFIVIARPSTKRLTYDEVRSNLVHVLKFAKIINREEESKRRNTNVYFRWPVSLARSSSYPVVELGKSVHRVQEFGIVILFTTLLRRSRRCHLVM